jgi:drug/metabolite transporter (DMT)-like permease
LLFAILALTEGVFAALTASGRTGWFVGWKNLLRSFGLGFGLFFVPIFLAHAAACQVSAYSRTALFTLVPVFSIVFQPYISPSAGPPSRFSLLAALAAIAGAFCVFPVELPNSAGSGVAFALVIVAAASVGAASCTAAEMTASQPVAPIAMIAAAGAAWTFATASVILDRGGGSEVWSDWPWMLALELPALMLLFWLFPKLTPVRMAARYLMAPLFAILMGIAVEQPHLEPREVLGVLLMAGASGYLLFAPEAGDSEGQPASFLPR